MDWPNGERRYPIPPGLFRWVHGPFWRADGKSIMIHAGTVGEGGCSLWILRLGDGSVEPDAHTHAPSGTLWTSPHVAGLGSTLSGFDNSFGSNARRRSP